LYLLALTVTLVGGAARAAGEASQGAAEAGLLERTRVAASAAWASTLEAFRPGTGTDPFGDVWEGIVPRLEQVLALEERHHELPERSWLGDDRASNRETIQDLLDEAAAILGGSPADHPRSRIAELERGIREAREEIAELRRKRVSAPTESLWQATAADYDQRIADREAYIAAAEEAIARERRAFAEELEAMGLDLAPRELEFLLSTVIGDDLVEMTVAFDNLRRITLQLEALVEESREDLESARRYYGMYTVLLRVLDHMHDRLIGQIDRRYLAEIDAITERTRALVAETRKLRRRADADRTMLDANLEAQQLTLRAAADYRGYLQEQRARLVRARKRLGNDLDVAVNTYETVKVSGELVGLMRTSERLIHSLERLQAPAPRTFENLEMKREFERLTRRLRESLPAAT
jgi:hypothetical protein